MYDRGKQKKKERNKKIYWITIYILKYLCRRAAPGNMILTKVMYLPKGENHP